MRNIADAYLAGFAALAFSSTLPAAPNVQAGLWEITTRTSMQATNMTMPALPPETKTQCISQADIQSPPNLIPAKSECAINDVETSGDLIRWEMACPGELPTKGSGETRYHGDTFDGMATVVSEAGGFRFDMSISYNGRRIGDCK